MKPLKLIIRKKMVTIFLFMCVIVVYGLSYYQRKSGYSEWMQNHSDYAVENVTTMSALDAYHWLKIARDLGEGRLGKGLIDPLKGYPDLDEYNSNPSLLAYFIYFASHFTNDDYYQAGLLLAPILAGMFVFPLFLYFHHLGFGAAAVFGGMIGSFSIAYHSRSNHGYVDTDMLNLFFPLAISALIVLINSERSLRTNLLLASGAGGFMFLFNWWYQQPVFFLIYLFFIATYLLSIRLPCKQILLLLGIYSLLSGPDYVFQSIASLRESLYAYFLPRTSGMIVWPDIMATINEASKSDCLTKLRRVHGLLPMSFAGLAGLIYLFIVRWKKMLPIAPLVLLGLWSLFGQSRFTMYLAPAIGVGAGVLIQLLVQQATRFFNLKSLPTAAITLLLMTAIFWSTARYTAYFIVPGAVPSREKIEAYLEIKKLVPTHSAMLSWWDEGYPLMQIGEFATYHDGQMHGIRTTLIAKALISARQEDLVSLLAYLEDHGFKELSEKVEMNNLTGEQMLRMVFDHPPKLREKYIHILFTKKMLEAFYGISFIGTWDFNKKISSPMKYDFLHCSPQLSNLVVCQEGQVDLVRGVVYDDTAYVPLKAAFIIQDGILVKQIDYSVPEGNYLQILIENNKIFMVQVLEERLFQSNFNQHFMLGNYDRRFFEEVYNDFPVARVLKVKTVTGE